MSSEAALDQLSQFIIFLSAQLDNHSRKLLCKPKYGGGREEGGGGGTNISNENSFYL